MRRIALLTLLLVSCRAQGALAQSDGAHRLLDRSQLTVDSNSESPVDEVPWESADGLNLVVPMTKALLDLQAAQESTDSVRLLGDFWGYHSRQDVLGWMVGDGDQFGDFAFGWSHYQPSGKTWGIATGAMFHFLAGPDQTDMPPRLYNFSQGFQKRQVIADFAYDVAVAVMAASDFEGSCRRGIRFPAHAVGYMAIEPNLDFVLGADFLDREDIQVLPVAGLIWRPDPDLRLELVFPYPSIYLQLTRWYRLYIGGGLGGGTWAVERDNEVDDLATYGDLRIAIGLEHWDTSSAWQSFEIAYLFDRHLEFTSQVGDYHPDSTVLIQSVSKY
jgi:hypothetical protein